MTEITDKVAEAMVNRFKDGIAKSAGKPFEETGVHLPNEFVWEAYAFAAVRAAIEHLRDNVSEMSCRMGAEELDDFYGKYDPDVADICFKAMLSQTLEELEDHRSPSPKNNPTQVATEEGT